MFTGIIEVLAEVAEIQSQPPGVRLSVRAAGLTENCRIGDSVALNGCCLTVVAIEDDILSFDAGDETLSRTTLGELAPSSYVNLETSLRAGQPIGGHYVTGHVDGIGVVDMRLDDGPWCTMWFRTEQRLLRQMASKGSVAVDGVSLTLVDVTDERFSVALIPHTLSMTTLGQREVGDRVNLETDVLAKYVERQLAARS
jgi:riboflavin synthase